MKSVNFLILISLVLFLILYKYLNSENVEILSVNDISTLKKRIFYIKFLWTLSLFLLSLIFFKTKTMTQITNKYINIMYKIIHYISLILVVFISFMLILSFYVFWI
jgi:hypothetical protein